MVIPSCNPLDLSRHLRVISSQSRGDARRAVRRNKDVLKLRRCPDEDSPGRRCELDSEREHDYPDVLGEGQFCLVTRGLRLTQPGLMEALHSGEGRTRERRRGTASIEERCFEFPF